MYRLITESLLGLHLEVDKLYFTPRPPRAWPSFKIHYRFHQTHYHITIQNGGTGNTIRRLTCDDVQQPENFICLVDDHADHQVQIELD